MAYREGGTREPNDGYRSDRKMLQLITRWASKESGESEAVLLSRHGWLGPDTGRFSRHWGHDPGENKNRRSLLASRDTSSSFVSIRVTDHHTTDAIVAKCRSTLSHSNMHTVREAGVLLVMVWTTVKVMSRRADRLIQGTADHEHEERLLDSFSDPKAVEVLTRKI